MQRNVGKCREIKRNAAEKYRKCREVQRSAEKCREIQFCSVS